MNYSQFLNMIPEALLVLALIIVFFADFCLHKSERKVVVLGRLTAAPVALPDDYAHYRCPC